MPISVGTPRPAGSPGALSAAIAQELEGRLNPSRAGGDAESGTPAVPRVGVAEGPRIVVVADDFDIFSSGGNEPLAPLLPYLPSARDLKLHVLLTRPVAGVSRAMFDVGLQTLRDTGGSLLLMSGDRGEGPVVPGVYAEQMLPGRAQLIRRGKDRRIVQVANTQGRLVAPAARRGDPDAA